MVTGTEKLGPFSTRASSGPFLDCQRISTGRLADHSDPRTVASVPDGPDDGCTETLAFGTQPQATAAGTSSAAATASTLSSCLSPMLSHSGYPTAGRQVKDWVHRGRVAGRADSSRSFTGTTAGVSPPSGCHGAGALAGAPAADEEGDECGEE